MVGYGIRQIRMVYLVGFAALLLAGSGVKGIAAQSPGEEHGLQITVNPADGRYDIAMPKSRSYALRAGVGVELDGRWLHASDYPRHVVEHSQVQGYLGEATDWQVSYSGLSGQPDLVYHLRAYSREPFGDIQVTVRNTTGKEIHLESIRCLDATEGPIIDLGGQSSKIEFSPTVSARTAQPLPSAISPMQNSKCIALSVASSSTTARAMRACFLER
jgi:hypothetical protein